MTSDNLKVVLVPDKVRMIEYLFRTAGPPARARSLSRCFGYARVLEVYETHDAFSKAGSSRWIWNN